jgi:hypothetical protein
MKMKTLLICLLLMGLGCSGVLAQSWSAALTTGMTAVDLSKSGNEYTIVLHNLTGIAGDTTDGYDVLVWSLEPFNLPTPQAIIEIPTGWGWKDGGFSMFDVANNSEMYYTPPALAPGGSYTFKFTSNLLTPANSGGPEDGSPGFLSHIAAVDEASPGGSDQRWTAYTPSGMPQTWNDRSVPVPEPGGLLALSTGIIGTLGFVIRRRK